MPSSEPAPRVTPVLSRTCLVTGGAGFIGANLVRRLVAEGWAVTVLDNLSRPGAELNLRWLRDDVEGEARFVQGDVRDARAVADAMAGAGVVYHLAAQTAVTTSVLDPVGDFEVNARGTLNVLEAARAAESPPVVVYASTNKVYGDLAGIPVVEEETRLRFADLPHGVDETQPLQLSSPYACSKGAADQYVLDYARIYGVPAVVLRQSCICGPWQLGSEEQGWVAWLVAAAALAKPITIYGSGKQVRDLLWVDDLVDAYLAVPAAIERTAGRAYNIGGGAERTISVWAEFAPLLARVTGRRVAAPRFEAERPGDQAVFYCDTRSAARDFGWRPRVGVEEGVGRLADWIAEYRGAFAALVAAA